MNEFEHNGKPNVKQQAEILKLISMAMTYFAGTAGMLSYSFTNRNDGSFEVMTFALGILGILLSGWSIVIAFLAIKGKARAITIVNLAIIAAGLLAFGLIGSLGVVLGALV